MFVISLPLFHIHQLSVLADSTVICLIVIFVSHRTRHQPLLSVLHQFAIQHFHSAEQRAMAEVKVQDPIQFMSMMRFMILYWRWELGSVQWQQHYSRHGQKQAQEHLFSAERGRTEYERVIERKGSGESEQEGAEFGDMEAFLTSLYCKKWKNWRLLATLYGYGSQKENMTSIINNMAFFNHMILATSTYIPTYWRTTFHWVFSMSGSVATNTASDWSN